MIDQYVVSRVLTLLTQAVSELVEGTPWPASEHASFKVEEARNLLEEFGRWKEIP